MDSITKLDMYDYILLPGVIRIEISSTTDPILVDILSEIEHSSGNIYVEGEYYQFLEQYDIFKDVDNKFFLDLHVVNLMKV